MSPLALVEGFPPWAQLAVTLIALTAAIVGILSGFGAALAFLCVMWPAIRNGERRAQRIETWVDSDEGRRVAAFLREKVNLDGKPASRGAFLSEDTETGGGKAQL